jgi:hypothetical protein
MREQYGIEHAFVVIGEPIQSYRAHSPSFLERTVMFKKEVSEIDFRMPQFRDAKTEDYEFRDDGQLARKDRWECAVRSIATAMGYGSRGEFEIEHLRHSVEVLVAAAKASGLAVVAFVHLPD